MNRLKLLSWLGASALAIAALSAPALAQQPAVPADDAGVQVLNRGPIHEAFAEPVVFDPKPSPVIAKPPPEPVEEMPPDQKPEGDNVQWIPGYWAWDDGRNDYIWISGIWRDLPPDRQWVPGYWNQVDGGFQWTSGAWVATDQGQVQYLPAPPQSLEAGANSPPPSADATWAPGYWSWQETRYVWRPGFWVPFQQDWVWVPAHYVWSPGGYLFVNGYWDRPLLRRGLPFAPVYFAQPVYRQPSYRYTPTIGLVASALASSLFVRPAYNQYYFGDYYAANNFQSGIYPWYSFHQSRYGYDPLFSHYAAVNTRRDPRWVSNLHDEYRYRRDHPDARPAHTFVQQQAVINRVNNVNNVNNVQNLIMARPLGQFASRGSAADGSALRFHQIDEAGRRAEARQSAQLQQFRQERRKHEAEGARRLQANQARPEPRRFDIPRSPVAAAIQGKSARDNRGRGAAPPPLPMQPRPDLSVRPPAASQPQPRRHDPHPDQLPPHFGNNNLTDGGRPGQPNIERREVLRPALPKKQAEPRRDQLPPGLQRKAEPRKDQLPPGLQPGNQRKAEPRRDQLPPGLQPGNQRKAEARRDQLPPGLQPGIQGKAESRRDQLPPGLQPGTQRRDQLPPGLQPGTQRRDQPAPGLQPGIQRKDAPRPAPPKRRESRKDDARKDQ